jgi:hypothetical protein
MEGIKQFRKDKLEHKGELQNLMDENLHLKSTV